MIRLLQILYVSLALGLDEFLVARYPLFCRFLSFFLFWRKLSDPLVIRFRLALERLGPIFIKFGQLLSTRRDLLTEEMANELAKLQDRAPAFSAKLAIDIIETSLKQPIEMLFRRFDDNPVASASVAQVHYAELHDGRCVAVKVLRPQILPIIESDLALLRKVAYFIRCWFPDGPRLRPEEVVTEFDHYLHDELNLLYEAGNATELRRRFLDSSMLIVPEVLYEYTTEKVLTLQWMEGIPISHIEAMHVAGMDLKKLSRLGVEIFFTQVFRDGFFHADMHPGNILVTLDHRYIALDFGIVGMLSKSDQYYLAINFLAFFNRDYLGVAHAHIASGWVAADTSAPAFAAAIRTVCEPFFNKPLSQISFGKVLIRLFEVSQRFNMSVQPQLILLQKTLLNIEGLGRQLDPELNLWETAQPFLERWMKEQFCWKNILSRFKGELSEWTRILPTLPRKVNQLLDCRAISGLEQNQQALLFEQKKQNKLLGIVIVLLTSLTIAGLLNEFIG